MPDPTVITIGNFDGVHLGHRALLSRARALADQHKAAVVALCFDPHPAVYLRPGSQPPALSTYEQRVQMLRAAGVDRVERLTPDEKFLKQSPLDFIARMVEQYHPLAIVEGEDFRFGHRRSGDMNALREMSARFGFEAVAVGKVDVTLGDLTLATVSSSLVRWLIGRGRMADTTRCLARPFELAGAVARGEQLGRRIGIPTANLDPASIEGLMIPGDGVYAGSARLADGRRFPAAISVGDKPTFDEKRLTVEAHLLDYTSPAGQELYGQEIVFTIARWLRDQYPFPSVGELTDQMSRDIDATRRLDRSGALDAPMSDAPEPISPTRATP